MGRDGEGSRLAKHRDGVSKLFAALSPVERVQVYGELFGGAYPHADVLSLPDAQPVQTGVYYSPGIEFLAFDVGVVEDGELRLLDYETATGALERAGLPFARPLFVGKYDAACTVSNEFQTTIPALLGLPPIGGNRAEGIVLKPYRDATFRPSVKKKIEAFAEVRFHAADRSRPGNSPLLQLTATSNSMCTPQRLDNAISKFGRVKQGDRKRREAVVGEVVADVMATLAEQSAALWKASGATAPAVVDRRGVLARAPCLGRRAAARAAAAARRACVCHRDRYAASFGTTS